MYCFRDYAGDTKGMLTNVGRAAYNTLGWGGGKSEFQIFEWGQRQWLVTIVMATIIIYIYI